MDTNTKVGVITTGALGTAGAITGKVIADHSIQKKADLYTKKADEYINSRIESNIDKIHSTLKRSKWGEAFKKIREKAEADFSKLYEKEIKNTKVKWVAGIAAAGLAIGTAITLINNRVKTNKAEKAQ